MGGELYLGILKRLDCDTWIVKCKVSPFINDVLQVEKDKALDRLVLVLAWVDRQHDQPDGRVFRALITSHTGRGILG